MTNSIKIHPSMKYHNRRASLEMYASEGNVRVHFAYTGHNHIPGFYLCSITLSHGLILDHGICPVMGDATLDLDISNRESLKIIGVDLI